MREKFVAVTMGALGYLAFFGAAFWLYNAAEPVNNPESLPVSEVQTLPTDNTPIQPADPSGDYYVNNGSSDCTQDCSGHEAGYTWAEENDVCDPDFDGGNSESFAEGVREYAYDNCYYEDENGSF